MSEDQKSYFLGVEGEQLGPLTEAELASKIREGSVSPQSLIWWEGRSDWEAIGSIEEFKVFFEAPQTNPPAATPPEVKTHSSSALPVAKKPRKKEHRQMEQPTMGDDHFVTFAPQGSEPNPVFGLKEAKIATEPLISKRSLIMGLVFIALCSVGWLALKIIPSGKSSLTASADKPTKTNKSKEQDKNLRKKKLTEASSSLLLNPNQAVPVLTELVNANIKDEVGQEAAQTLVSYFQKSKQFELAGNLLIKLDRPADAANMYVQEPRLASQAESAFFLAFKKSQGKESADYLEKDIKLLLNPLKNPVLAKERIELFEKTFPALTHSFSYYSLPTDQKIQLVFTNLSHFFVEEVNRTIKEEFPQISLGSRPIVEVKKDTIANFRLIGRYQGDVVLRTDTIKNIYFLYWLIDGQWVLVDTNLTKERQSFAATMRKKYETRVLSPASLLTFLEGQFQREFPDRALHEVTMSQKTIPAPKQN